METLRFSCLNIFYFYLNYAYFISHILIFPFKGYQTVAYTVDSRLTRTKTLTKINCGVRLFLFCARIITLFNSARPHW